MKYIKLIEKKTGNLIDVPYNAPGMVYSDEGNGTTIKWLESDGIDSYYKTVTVKESLEAIKRKIDLQKNEIDSTK